MSRRRYNQFCGLAGALDVVGERWTPLIVRDLLAGPQRYSDLATSLRGIGTSLLAERLELLEDHGVLRRRELPPPAASTVYELTDAGLELADALLPLAIWGARHRLDEWHQGDQRFEPAWSLGFLARRLRTHVSPTQTTVFQITVDDRTAHISLDRGTTTVSRGPHTDPDIALTMTSRTLATTVAGTLDIEEAIDSGHITVTGEDPTALRQLLSVLRDLPTRELGQI